MSYTSFSRARRTVCDVAAVFVFCALLVFGLPASGQTDKNQRGLDRRLRKVLRVEGFTGRVQSRVEQRLGRKLNPHLANLGRLLFFDVAGGLHDDNTCAGCHSPTRSFGDTQSIAIGVPNNLMVGPDRTGLSNQRRTPSVVNTTFYPNLMWNGRFASLSGAPFDNSQGFEFPLPERKTRFPPNDPIVNHLISGQAHIPPTELVGVAGFTGTKGIIGARFDQFDDGLGGVVPPPDVSGFRHEPIRQEVLKRLNGNANYRKRFGRLFPEVAAGAPIDFTMFGRAIAEFEFTQVYANAPIDKFARGSQNAMADSQKRGALIFFGQGKCSQCRAVGGQSNEMFRSVFPRLPRFSVWAGGTLFSMVRMRTKISGWSKLPVTRPTDISSAARHSVMPRFNRRSSTMERSPESRMPFAITLMLESRCATTMPYKPAWLST